MPPGFDREPPTRNGADSLDGRDTSAAQRHPLPHSAMGVATWQSQPTANGASTSNASRQQDPERSSSHPGLQRPSRRSRERASGGAAGHGHPERQQQPARQDGSPPQLNDPGVLAAAGARPGGSGWLPGGSARQQPRSAAARTARGDFSPIVLLIAEFLSALHRRSRPRSASGPGGLLTGSNGARSAGAAALHSAADDGSAKQVQIFCAQFCAVSLCERPLQSLLATVTATGSLQRLGSCSRLSIHMQHTILCNCICCTEYTSSTWPLLHQGCQIAPCSGCHHVVHQTC